MGRRANHLYVHLGTRDRLGLQAGWQPFTTRTVVAPKRKRGTSNLGGVTSDTHARECDSNTKFLHMNISINDFPDALHSRMGPDSNYT